MFDEFKKGFGQTLGVGLGSVAALAAVMLAFKWVEDNKPEVFKSKTKENTESKDETSE